MQLNASIHQAVPAQQAPLSISAKKTAATSLPRFGNASGVTGPIKPRKILEKVDFIGKGASPASQIAVIFGSLITWRLLAANDRRRASESKRWNELRENFLRDMLGFGFWFLGVPMVQRGYLKLAAQKNPQFENALVQHAELTKAERKGLSGFFKRNNPLYSIDIPTSQQVRDQKELALKALKEFEGKEVYTKTEAAFDKMIKHRNFATAIGLGSTILSLGLGINLINFYLTQKNMHRNELPQMPQSPMQPQQPSPAVFPPVSQVRNGFQNPTQPFPFASVQQNPVQPYPFAMPVYGNNPFLK